MSIVSGHEQLLVDNVGEDVLENKREKINMTATEKPSYYITIDVLKI